MAKKTRRLKGLTIQFLPYAEIEDLDSTARIKKLLEIILKEKVIIIQGRLRAANPYDTEAQAFNSSMTAIAQEVGKAMEGGVLRQEDVKKYRIILPQIWDTPEVAQKKIDNVIKTLELKLQERLRRRLRISFASAFT